MIPATYKMVDLGGLDLAEVNGSEVPGIYAKISGAYATCRIAILCNWKFADIVIAPAHVLITVDENDNFIINDLIVVSQDDTISLIGVTPDPTLVELTVTENGLYEPEEGVDGFSSVDVNVPDIPAVLESLSATENGTYIPPQGIDGYNPVVVSVGPPPDPSLPSSYQELEYISFTPNAGILITIPDSGLFEALFEVDALEGQQECPFGYRLTTTDSSDFEFQVYSNTGEARVYFRNWPNSSSPSIPEIELHTPISLKSAVSGIRTSAYIGRYYYNPDASSGANFYSLNGKVYYVRVTDLLTGLVVAKYVPCYRKSDNVLGYYDVVGENFYSTQYIDHDGTIVAGPIKN